MRTSRRDGDGDRMGFDENRDYLAEFLAVLIPRWLARRAVTISVTTERHEYDLDSPVRFVVTIRNRLPVPVTLTTPRLRLWGWAVDGEVEATDECVYSSDTQTHHALDANETIRVEQTWNGRFERSDAGPNGRSKWVLPEPGTHELSVFIATEEPRARDIVELELR